MNEGRSPGENPGCTKDAFTAAVALLARREHGAVELAEKLAKKGYEEDVVQSAIAKCQSLALQSDQRFVDMLLRLRIQQGYGSERIGREIKMKKVERELYEQALLAESIDWVAHARRVLHKKYKSSSSTSWQMQQKQKQFLLYRGFALHTISQVFVHDEMTE